METLKLILNPPAFAVDPLEVLAEGKVLELEALKSFDAYIDSIAEAIPPERLQAPRAALSTLRGLCTSLTALAAQEQDTIRQGFGNYSDKEHITPATLYLLLDLIQRHRETEVPPTAVAKRAKKIATKRGWKRIDDATETLLEMEKRQLRQAAGALRMQPELLQELYEDDNTRSFEDAIDDIQRRLDQLAKPHFAPHLTQAKRLEQVNEQAETLLSDAKIFRQGREGRKARSVKLTLHRNVVFTAFKLTLESLQRVLRAALERQPEKMAKIEGAYWWNLDRLSRPAPKAEEPSEGESSEEPQEGSGDPALLVRGEDLGPTT
jgi:hypothetical protein